MEAKVAKSLNWRPVDSFAGSFSRPELTYSRPCPVCNSLRHKTILEFSDFQFYTDSAEMPKRVSIRDVQCLDCFAVFMNPCYSPYGFSVLFAEAGQSYGATEGRPAEQLTWLGNRGLLEAGSRLLDVGCYDGRFLARLPAQVGKIGVDIDAPAIERGRAQYAEQGIAFIHGDFENFVYEATAPTVITMFHVLEHLPRPVAVLRKLQSIATKDTRLVVEVPVLENGKTNDVNGFLSVQHMTHFSRASLRNALHFGGWKVAEWQEMPDYNGCRVLAQPGSMAETNEFERASGDVGEVHGYLAFWYQSLTHAESQLARLAGGRKLLIWGAGAHTEFIYQHTSLFRSDPRRVYLLIDSDPLKQGRTWRGIPICAPTVVADVDWSETQLLPSSYGGQESIVAAAMKLGVPKESIVRLYDQIRIY